MAQTPPLITVGYTNRDTNITPEGTTHLPGGGAYFSALGASLVGQPVGLVTKVGDDFDLTFLKKHVSLDGVCIDSEGKTAECVQTYLDASDPTQRTIEMREGVSTTLSPEDFVDKSVWEEDPIVVHISTMPPLQQRSFFSLVRERYPSALISLDTDAYFFENPQHVAHIEENLKMVDMVFLNREETDRFAKTIPLLPHVIAKKDKDGAQVFRFGELVALAQAPRVTVQDATGAGDILAGVYLGNLVSGKTEQQSLDVAVSLASRSVQEIGVEHLFPIFAS